MIATAMIVAPVPGKITFAVSAMRRDHRRVLNRIERQGAEIRHIRQKIECDDQEWCRARGKAACCAADLSLRRR